MNSVSDSLPSAPINLSFSLKIARKNYIPYSIFKYSGAGAVESYEPEPLVFRVLEPEPPSRDGSATLILGMFRDSCEKFQFITGIY